jgi:predicted nucleic acid-binding protein
VTVVDSSAVIDLLLGTGAARELTEILESHAPAAAPDLLVFEVIAVLRRHVLRGSVDADRAGAAVDDLGDLAIDLFPTLALRARAWELRKNITAADAMFVALAEWLRVPLATKDHALATAARAHSKIETIELNASP